MAELHVRHLELTAEANGLLNELGGGIAAGISAGLSQRPRDLGEGATYVDPEILQTLKLAQVYLQFRVNLQAFGFGVLEEGPELLQSVKLA